jgi:ubiquinone/menaquinone biosynthesis C-methylase UbiE
MHLRSSALFALAILLHPCTCFADVPNSTRVAGPEHHACTGSGGYPYREKSDYVLRELDLKPGDNVVDVGAGDGWWSSRMAEAVGETGTVYASEVDQKKVDKMQEELADVPQIKAYLSPTDGTDLPENSCDLAFMSKVYHHLDEGTHVDYLKHLLHVVRPTGRLCIIEKYPEIAANGTTHGWTLSLLIKQAEEAGWIPVRCELMRGTYHYVAIFVPGELFPPEPKRKKR